ncbi:MAG: transcription antitermination factor NusB [Acidobacteriota bacterium]
MRSKPGRSAATPSVAINKKRIGKRICFYHASIMVGLPQISPARRTAFDVLVNVEEGANSTDLLFERTKELSGRDAGLATELVLGSLRRRAQLDFLAVHFSGRDSAAFDTEVRLALHLGIYQMRYLERIPAHAAISESVELVRRAGKRSATGFVNAILRNVTKDDLSWPDRSVELCMPEWLLQGWETAYGADVAAAVARASLETPETFLRVPVGMDPPQGAVATALPGCWMWPKGPAPEGFRVQDMGSQSIVPKLALEAGLRFLDLCAAPGGKTLQAMETPIRAIASDRLPARARDVAALGVPTLVLDGTRSLPFPAQTFDRILVDAPCSGTGTLGRNPEIRWRIQPDDLDNLHQRQVKLLRNALTCAKLGGRVVYSTCSLERTENEEVVREAVAGASGWQCESTAQRLPGRDPGDGFFAAVITSA